MLERGEIAKSATSVFFEKYNDIDIFVEDSSKESKKLYAKLFSKALADRIRIERVFPLGNKHAVVDACKRNQGPGGRKRVYVIDGDMDLCLGACRDPLIRLYRLPRYCIENFLIDGPAAATLVERESLELEIDEVISRLAFAEWIEKNAKPLRRLFLTFAVVKMLASDIPTVGIGYSRLVESASGEISALKIEHLIGKFRDAVDARNERGAFVREFRKIAREHRMKSDEDFLLHFVSGKDFLLPLMKLRMNSVSKVGNSMAWLKLNLAELVPSGELIDIIKFVE